MATKDIPDKMVCVVIDALAKQSYPTSACEYLSKVSGQPYKVCWRALERADRRGLISYGVSLNYPWLTERGRIVLAG